MFIEIIVENIGEVSRWVEEYLERSWDCSEVSTVTSRNHHLSFAVVVVVYVPYEWLLYYPSICRWYFTYSTIIRKSGGEFLHITAVIRDLLELQDQ